MAGDIQTAIASAGQPPPDVGVQASDDPPNPAAVDAIASAGATPDLLDVTAEPLAPLAAAGVDLAKLTMAMISGSLLLLVLILMAAENADSDRTVAAQDKLFSYVLSGTDSGTDRRVPSVVGAFQRAAADSAVTLASDEEANAKALIAEALQNPATTPGQRAQLEGKCLPLPAAGVTDRAAALQACAATLQTIFADSGSMAQRVSFIQAAQKAMADAEAARRAFWLQVAQLVLINLLLPILTGLLGYIFGTQQAKNE